MAAEWIVIKLDAAAKGGFTHHIVGNQSRFELADAEKHVAALGEGWRLLHFRTMVPPKDHQTWLNSGGKTNWAP